MRQTAGMNRDSRLMSAKEIVVINCPRRRRRRRSATFIGYCTLNAAARRFSLSYDDRRMQSVYAFVCRFVAFATDFPRFT